MFLWRFRQPIDFVYVTLMYWRWDCVEFFARTRGYVSRIQKLTPCILKLALTT